MSAKYILVTGGCGFIGSNFITYFLENHDDYHLLNLDAITYAADESRLKNFVDHPLYTLIKGDICDRKLVSELFQIYNIQGVIHFAAESHVDNSIHDPGIFMTTNIIGTYNLLEAARKCWTEKPHELKAGYQMARFLHVSTDEVYGTLGEEGFFSEETCYAPNSPYSASKASSDMIVRSYFHTYGLPVVTTNCSNNYGPMQHKEKLIPTIISKAVNQQSIPIYGNGNNIRDWLFVMDHAKAIDTVFHSGTLGETYCVGSRNEQRNIDIVEKICEILDQIKPSTESYKKLITFVEDRPGHDLRYAINPRKIENELGWKAETSFEEGLMQTVRWYLANE
jgi:dTDP-glucose 4,6-dehydratase